jgi:PPM family protein phosphatase
MYGASDVGRVRKSNQDAFYCSPSQGIAVVADGIGGRKGGEIASRIVVDGMRKAIVEVPTLRPEEVGNFIIASIDQLNQDVIISGVNRGLAGMGTTLECLVFIDNQIHLAHVGDSRTLLFSQKHLWQLTIDHNVKNFVDRGWIDKSELGSESRQEALIKSVGLSPRCEIDLYCKKLEPGEIYLTCSDGLTSMVDPRRINQIINDNLDSLEKIPELLIAKANQNGGKDNVTVVISAVRSN